ncbi:hypothetical protein ATCC90586_001617 [Pythium insidiosum]|nr:hypothetical protein ATCC90586_001617 [Pythium insidiosum]
MRSEQNVLKLQVRAMCPDAGTGVKKATCSEQHPNLRKIWAEPDWSTIKIRGKKYLQDRVKQGTDEPLFELVWFDMFSGEQADLLHIAQHPNSFAQKALAKYGNQVPQLFVVTLLIPGTPVVACVQYFAMKSDAFKTPSEATALWQRFVEGDDAFRRSRLKLIPSIPEGPWVVKKSVGNKPVILGNALQLHFYQTPRYLEVCVDICSDRVAKHVTSLCRSHCSSFKVDMGFVVEGQSEGELPERLAACVQSARQAKRLGNLAAQRANEPAVREDDEEEEEVEWEEKRPTPASFSFLLDSDSDDEDGDDDEDKDVEEETVVVEQVPRVAAQPTAETATGAKKSKKKKGKKAKSKGGKQVKGEEEESGEEDVDDILNALAAEAGELSMDQRMTQRNESENMLFGVQLSYINADKEMKRIFGVREVRDTSASRRVDPRNAARKTTKKVFLVTPHDEWPRPPTFVAGGIRWTRANKPSGPSWNGLCQYFEITWSMAYKKAQEEFQILQQTHDPNLISHFLHRHPFHIDALLQMSEVFQHHGQMDHASDCIKRCMYVLELAWADQFDVTKGNCRMDIHTEHNDGFFKALFLLTKQVGRRGCMRSAFETAKLLLGLDPQGDPMNVLLAIDYYAISARQYDFVVALAASNLEAVDRFEQGDKSKATKRGKGNSPDGDNISALPNIQFSSALATYFLGNEQEATEMLARALLRYPTLLTPLLDKIAVNKSSSNWQAVLGSRVFANARGLDENSALQHVLDIYVSRNHTIWKVNEVQAFLLRGAQLAVSSPTLASTHTQVSELPASLLKYKRSYPGDYSDEITTLPPDHPMLQPAQLPDLGHLNAEDLAQLQAQVEAGNLPADANPLLLFLQTLLPWNRVEGAGAAPPQRDDE